MLYNFKIYRNSFKYKENLFYCSLTSNNKKSLVEISLVYN